MYVLVSVSSLRCETRSELVDYSLGICSSLVFSCISSSLSPFWKSVIWEGFFLHFSCVSMLHFNKRCMCTNIIQIYIQLYWCRNLCAAQLAKRHLPALLILEAKSSKSYVSFWVSLVILFYHFIVKENFSYF